MFIQSLVATTVIVRHGETEWNSEDRSQGQLDTPRLSRRGQEQARQLARDGISPWQRQVHTLAVSSLQRARYTADIVREECAASASWRVWSTELLWEAGVPWAGLYKPEAAQRFPEAYRRFRHEPAASASMQELHRRVQQFWQRRQEQSAADDAANGTGTVWLVVAHNQTNRALLTQAAGWDLRRHRVWKQSNCGCSVVDAKRRIHLVNYVVPQRAAGMPATEADKQLLELECDERLPQPQRARNAHGIEVIRGRPVDLQRALRELLDGADTQQLVWYPGGRTRLERSGDGSPWTIAGHNWPTADAAPSVIAQYVSQCVESDRMLRA